jgi:hypothetical protein
VEMLPRPLLDSAENCVCGNVAATSVTFTMEICADQNF